MDLADLTQRLRDFSAERDWQPFNTPRNLVLALTGEVGELAELFQWLTEEQAAAPDEALRERIGEEVTDVLSYLLLLADACGVDLDHAVPRKMAMNAVKHPPARLRPPS